MKKVMSVSEKILGDSNQIIDESINKLLGAFDSLQFVRDQFQYELEIRNEDFLKKFDQILEKSLNSIESLKHDRQYVNKRMAKRISKAERTITIQEKELKSLREKNIKLESDHLELRSQHKEIQYSEDRLRSEIKDLRQREKELKESVPKSPRRGMKRNLSSVTPRGKRRRRRKSSSNESPSSLNLPQQEVFSSTPPDENNENQTKKDPVKKTHMIITDHFLDELVSIENEYSENMDALNDEEKKMYLNKVKFLVERSQMNNQFERKLAFLKRKRDNASINLEKAKIKKEKNKIKYFNKKLLDVEKQVHTLEQEKRLHHGRNVNAFQKLDASINKTVKASVQNRHEQMKREREHKLMLIRENVPRDKIVIIFTDIQGSTKIWQNNSNVMLKALKTHNAIFHKYIKMLNGYEVKTEGDSYMIAFQVVKHAVDFCMKVQLALLSADWPKELDQFEESKRVTDKDGFQLFAGLRIRMGMNYGKPVSIEKSSTTNRFDYFGPMVNRAARVEGMAHGGEILVSESLFAQIRMNLNQFFMPVDVTNLGKKKLKGFGKKKENVFRVTPTLLKERSKHFLSTVMEKRTSKRNPLPGGHFKGGAGSVLPSSDLSKFIERTESKSDSGHQQQQIGNNSTGNSSNHARPGSGKKMKGGRKRGGGSSLLHILKDDGGGGKGSSGNNGTSNSNSILTITESRRGRRERKHSTALEHLRKGGSGRTRARKVPRSSMRDTTHNNNKRGSPAINKSNSRMSQQQQHSRTTRFTPSSSDFGSSDDDLIGLISDLEKQ